MTGLQTSDDDLYVFGDEQGEDAASDGARAAARAWKILIVDDEPDVHHATMFALQGVLVQGRHLSFLHAYSAREASELLATVDDIAVILLDVVMEREDAGLALVHHIRNELKLTDTRIVLRTGQPGYAPELEAIRDYDINDYRTKSELTRSKLFAVVTAAVRSYEQIRTITASRRGLELIVRSSAELMGLHGMRVFAEGVITQIAALLGINAEGVVCAHEESAGGRLVVVAGAGRYGEYVNLPVSDLADQRIRASLTRCLLERRTFNEEGCTTLFFSGDAMPDVAAFLDMPQALSEVDRNLLEVFCTNISMGLQNVVLFERLHNFAYYDQLSKLSNRMRFVNLIDERMAWSADSGDTLALLDIAGFASINDSLGHQFGDQLLCAVGQMLADGLGQGCEVARVGPDVFGVLGPDAVVQPSRIRQLFDSPLAVAGQSLPVQVSIGLVRLSESGGAGSDTLKDANIALKRAKSGPRGEHYYFTRELGLQIRERLTLMQALQSAFDQQRLLLFYQPQIDLSTGQMIGMEALMRWRSDEGRWIPPDQFIPIAESSGLIVDLGCWALRTACHELARLERLGLSGLRMSVNVSVGQFRSPRLREDLAAALRDSGVAPSQLELEITESVAMDEPEALIRIIDDIKAMGVKIAMDDFGTGYSSLSYLQRLHIDRLKIDRSFVSPVNGSSRAHRIAEMVIQLGHSLGLTVIAEGVEDTQQAETLARMGCHQAQGWLYAKAMPADELESWIRSRLAARA